MKPLSVTAIQFPISWEDKERNFQTLSGKIKSLPERQQVVFLPEMFATGFSMNKDLAEPMEGPTVTWMKQMAQSERKIICGSVMIQAQGKIYNRMIWMLPNGTAHYYDKRHLFAFAGEDRIFSPGSNRVIVQVNGWKLCLNVCYDLRFPVWCRQQDDLYDVLVFIANWPESRKHAWTTLLQARAIENQCYVIGINRIGKDGNGIDHSGDSMIVDPLGAVVRTVGGEEALLQADLNPEALQQARARFPFLSDADRFTIN